MTGVHTIIIEVVVSQPQMSCFTMTIDIVSTMLRPWCRWRTALLHCENAHDLLHDAQKRYSDLILHYTWARWRHCVRVSREWKWVGIRVTRGQTVCVWGGGVFIGWWGIQFEFLWFFGAQMVKNGYFSIQTTSFKFKLKTWTNQRTPRHYGRYRPGCSRHGSPLDPAT
jgi:hypothetical protein